MIRFPLVPATILFLAAGVVGQEKQTVPYNDPKKMGEFAKDVVADLKKQLPMAKDRSLTVAVMPFGDQNGDQTPALANRSTEYQYELIQKLVALANNEKLVVLQPADIRDAFNKDPKQIEKVTPNDQIAAAQVLTQVKIDAVVFGYIYPPQNNVTKIAVTVLVANPKGQVLQYPGQAPPPTSPTGPANASPVEPTDNRRFELEFWHNGKQLEMFQEGPEGDKRRVYYLLVPKELKVENPDDAAECEKKKFSVKIVNRGAGAKAESAGNRVFAVALTLDGVNSIYHDEPDGKSSRPFGGFPDNAAKWVMSDPGYVIKPGTQSEPVQSTVPAGTADHSARPVLGFQKGKDKAAPFVFVDTANSISFKTLATTKTRLGLVEASVFAEQKPGEPIRKDSPGGITGSPTLVPHPVCEVKFPLHAVPDEVIRVFYRFDKKDFPTPEPEKLTPIVTKAK